MAKIIIDDSELIDAHSMRVLEKLADFFSRVDDPYRMPEEMSLWLGEYNAQHKVDTFFSVPVGYSHMALRLDFMFKKEMIVMTFSAPDGMRLMEIRLHE